MAQTPNLVPLDDEEATASTLPAGISREAPEIFGNYAQVWESPDGEMVLQYYGDFDLHMGERRLSSRDAVIWMEPDSWEGERYYHYEVFLSEQAWVRDAGGTVTSGPTLFVTFNSYQPPAPEADVFSEEPSGGSALFQEATRVRMAARRRWTGEPPPQEMDVLDPAAEIGTIQPEVKPVVRIRWEGEVVIDQEEGRVILTGDVYLSQGPGAAGEILEIRADAAVVFLSQPIESEEADPLAGEAPDLQPIEMDETLVGDDAAVFGGFGGAGGRSITGAFLRGDVVMTRAERMIRAGELYYDFENDRALILDVVMRAMVPMRDVPIYVRAEQVRQLSSREYYARNAKITTSEFYTPHVHIGADRVYLTDNTPRDARGQVVGLEAGTYRMYDTTLNVEGVPIAYWPYSAGDFRREESALRSVQFGYSDDFGVSFESNWYLFNLLGVEAPMGVDAVLSLDYYSERGPGVGLDVDYEQETSYGLFRGYYIHDEGEDNLGPFRENDPDTEHRGRLTWRHREFLGDGWELTLEGSYISDPTFLEEYFNEEFEEGKEQETLVYLKKQEDNWALTALAQWRALDFLTQTEHLPDLGFHWVGLPLGELASVYSESQLGWVRRRVDNRRYYETGLILDNDEQSDMTFRSMTRKEIDFPIKIENLNIVPYAAGQLGYWDGSLDGGATDRMFGSIGVRTGTQFWRVFENINSQILDVNGVRHIIKPEATSWLSASNQDSLDLYPFDYGIETIDDFYGTSLALRQRWQTKRGGPGQWRVVDWIRWDIEVNLFGNVPEYEDPIGRFYEHRPENSVARNHIRSDFMYRISDTTAVLSDLNFDLNRGNVDLLNISYAVERSPRFGFGFGYRYIGDTQSNLIGYGATYRINEKYTLAGRFYYDLEQTEVGTFELAVIRKWPRWYTALTFDLDNIEEDFSVGIAIWPEGAPGLAIGERRYVDFATSTAIRPEGETVPESTPEP